MLGKHEFARRPRGYIQILAVPGQLERLESWSSSTCRLYNDKGLRKSQTKYKMNIFD